MVLILKTLANTVLISMRRWQIFNELGFLLLDESKEGDAAKIQPDNYTFKDLANQTQIFLER